MCVESQSGWRAWTFGARGLLFVVVGLVLVLYRHRLPGWWGKGRQRGPLFAYSFLAFSILWTLAACISTYAEYSRLSAAVQDGRVEVVEGIVRSFDPMPASGHKMERFCVERVCFSYSDFVVTNAFNQTASHGGPIRDGLRVRVTFVGNDIVKLQVSLTRLIPST